MKKEGKQRTFSSSYVIARDTTLDILTITIYVYRYNATDSTLLIIRALYNFESSSNNTIYKHYAITTIVNRSRSTGTTGSTSRRYYRHKEEQKRGKLRENYIAIIEAGKNPFI